MKHYCPADADAMAPWQGAENASWLCHLRLQHLAGVQVAVLGHVLVHQLVRDADDVQPGISSVQHVSDDARSVEAQQLRCVVPSIAFRAQ